MRALGRRRCCDQIWLVGTCGKCERKPATSISFIGLTRPRSATARFTSCVHERLRAGHRDGRAWLHLLVRWFAWLIICDFYILEGLVGLESTRRSATGDTQVTVANPADNDKRLASGDKNISGFIWKRLLRGHNRDLHGRKVMAFRLPSEEAISEISTFAQGSGMQPQRLKSRPITVSGFTI